MVEGDSLRDEQCEVAVLGAGIAGLTAASELADRDVVVLEADERVGGRIMSARRGEYWVNLGAQFAEGKGPFIEALERCRIARGTLAGTHASLAWRGRIVPMDRLTELMLRSRLSPLARIELARIGLRIRRGYRRAALNPDKQDAHRYRTSLDAQPASVLASGVRTEEVRTIFRGLAEYWAGAEPEEMTAAYLVIALGSALVDPSDVENLSMPIGGNQMLTDALAAELGERIRLGAAVSAVSFDEHGVEIVYERRGVSGRLVAQQCVVALPADVALSVLRSIQQPQRDALAAVRYAQYVLAGIFTSETEPQPWDRFYAIATPGLSFQVIFNHAAALRREGPRKPGGALVCYAGGDPARALASASDSEVTDRYLDDLDSLFPGFRRQVDEVIVKRWPKAIPIWRAGERGGVALLRQPMGPIHFAGDYLGNSSAPAAAMAGQSAARSAAQALARVCT